MGDYYYNKIIELRAKAEKSYMTRSDIMEEMKEWLPENSVGLTTTMSNIKGTGFLRTQFDKDILEPYLDEWEYLKVIDWASKVIALEYSKKRKSDSKDTSKMIKYSFYLSFILLLAFSCMAFYMPTVNALWYDLLTYAVLACSFSMIMFIGIVNLFIKGRNL
jgi:uncharacterized membrane protein YhdT